MREWLIALISFSAVSIPLQLAGVAWWWAGLAAAPAVIAGLWIADRLRRK